MGMKYLGAYLMAVIGGKESPTADDVKAILEAGGIEIDEDILSKVIERMDGKTAHEMIATGFTKFAACGGGGGGGGGGGAAAGGGGAAAGGDAAADAPKEEAKKEEEEEEEEDMDFDLFG
mmetsp:Transcript_138875/g.245383  ORF Transcript_138875/g.245383 Transcript_138875/m.245383 type:complete len:120 (+) Transcript_138875:129-488(+)